MMTTPTYLISHGTDFANTVVYAFPSRESAKVVADTMNGTVHLVEREEDVAFSGPALVAIFNALTQSGIRKFESRTVGIRRLLSILPQVARQYPNPATATATSTPNGKTKMSDTEVVTNGSGKRGRASKFADDATIHVLAEENPKRAGSAARSRFDLYKNGMTVAEFIEAGGTLSDLHNDSDKGYISI